MKKLFSILLASFLVLGLASSALALDNNPESASVEIFGSFRGPNGVTPTTKIVKVRYSLEPPGGAASLTGNLSSGDCVAWDTNSADGYSISACVSDNQQNYAGILVTDLTTADNSIVRGDGDNVGYIALKGYALAKVDTSKATTGQRLLVNAETLTKSLATLDLAGGITVSSDIGLLLTDTGSDGLMPVWLD